MRPATLVPHTQDPWGQWHTHEGRGPVSSWAWETRGLVCSLARMPLELGGQEDSGRVATRPGQARGQRQSCLSEGTHCPSHRFPQPASGARQPLGRGLRDTSHGQTRAGEGTASSRAGSGSRGARPHSHLHHPGEVSPRLCLAAGGPARPPPRRRPPASQQPRPPEMKTPPRQQAVIRSAQEPLIHYEPRGREIRQKYSASLISGGRKIRVGGFFCFSFLYIDTDIPLWGNVHFPFAELQPVCRHPRPRKTPWVWPPPLTQRASSLLFVLYNINSIFKLHMNTVPHLGGAAACRGKPPHPG